LFFITYPKKGKKITETRAPEGGNGKDSHHFFYLRSSLRQKRKRRGGKKKPRRGKKVERERKERGRGTILDI